MKTPMRSPRVRFRLIAAIRATPGDKSSPLGEASLQLLLGVLANSAGLPFTTVVVFVVEVASSAMVLTICDSNGRSKRFDNQLML